MTVDPPAHERVERLTEPQVEDLCRLYAQEWWTTGREPADVRAMLEGCDVTVGFVEPGTERLVGFVRVVSDLVYKALVLDVIVDEAWRDHGLGGALLDAVLAHPRLRRVRHFELYCRPSMTDYYRRWGFTDDLGEMRFMRLVREPDRTG